ncbi:MAG: tRNA-specific 2-thiouridylase MnmA [Phycisphaerae bacterium]|nr:MAG: tRNA-specific 2-thiouridylase MnmA [Phycisphaerae bacterium]
MIGYGKKVVVAMSGGVDSSVAAALLRQQGFEVIGCFMRLGTPEGVEAGSEQCRIDPSSSATKHKQGCCSVLDATDARRVAQMLDIPFYVLNFQDDFGRVIDYFVSEYNRGRTPNPCVRCNDWLKFGRLAKYAQAVGADYVASGHYARVGQDPVTRRKTLLRGLDHKKDQSYVLFGMPRNHVEHLLLPIGEYQKDQVRKIAEELKLPVFNKPDSQEICFVPDQDYAGLVKRRSHDTFKEGQLVTTTGQVVGTHQGYQHFTIGQRKGVGVAFGRPIYVVGIDPAQNRVVLGDKEDLMKKSLLAKQINILSDRLTLSSSMRCQAKIRYNHTPQDATITWTDVDEIRVTFDQPQSAITPGQAVVCYDGDVVLAGGWIESSDA